VDQNHILFDKNVVLTGTRDKQVIDFLKSVGANQTSSVSQNTYLVITKNEDEDTEKAEQARKLNVPIITIEEFTKQYL
jgi:NAD-dependent DNA ligase